MARPKLGETETERMQLKITAAEIQAIDDWRFENRMPSRSEAVRRLCQIGLRADRHIHLLGKEIYATSDAVKVLDAAWQSLLDEFVDEKIDREAFLSRAVAAIHDLFPDVKKASFDAHDRFTDFGLEFNALSEAVTIEDAIAASDREASEAKDRWVKWLEMDAEVKRQFEERKR